MAQTKEGAIKLAARYLGISPEEYAANRASGLKWCSSCQDWQPTSDFALNRARTDGLANNCRLASQAAQHARYVPKLRPPSGRRLIAPRAGDKKQAERRISYLVDLGKLPPATALACFNCGHIWEPGKKRHEYHHHLGYEPLHHEDVIPLCRSCHQGEHLNRNATHGSDRPGAKLTERDIVEIRRLRADAHLSFEKLGRKFGVSDSAIWAILSGRTWKHVEVEQ